MSAWVFILSTSIIALTQNTRIFVHQHHTLFSSVGKGEAVTRLFKKKHVQGVAKGSYETLGIVGGEYFPVCSGKAMGGGDY